MNNLILGSGSYAAEDVLFLLNQVDTDFIDVSEKEALIQSGKKHYSEMVSIENAPSEAHVLLYNMSMALYAERMAIDVRRLAFGITSSLPKKDIVLISLVRAGIPLGVLLKRELQSLNITCFHYGVSIIRDRGIDVEAMKMIINKHGTDGVIFVDGWTGKGAISDEIKRSLVQFEGFPEEPRLVVLADPCGKAWMAASAEDWLIPCGILGATVSGLISRTIWPAQGGLHGSVVYQHLVEHDESRNFIDAIIAAKEKSKNRTLFAASPWLPGQKESLSKKALDVIDHFAKKFSIDNINRIKPGIAEATRAVMRRVPEKVFVRSKKDKDVALLIMLTEKSGLEVNEVGTELGPYRALTIIKRVS
ncbi:cysteine protease StiP domain-containing protein [Rheinheimera sp.]|uniref:cysteine protease StiP domain-containing protein n=2 Tax=Rheinheimera sp. TaxID=1869214 RepID=UPI00404885D0